MTSCGYGSWCSPGRHEDSFRFNLQTAERTRVRIPAARCARVLLSDHPLQKQRGRRECRVLAAPTVSAQKSCAKARVDQQVQPRHPGIPCAVVYGLLRTLPGEPAFATVARAMHQMHRLRTWRLHGRARTTRLRRPRSYRSSSIHPRPPHPASHFVTIAIRPSSSRRDAPKLQVICPTAQADGMRHINATGNVLCVIPGRCEASNPESRDSGFSPADCPGMTSPYAASAFISA